MNIFRENDVVLLREGVEAKIITGGGIFIPEGAEGTVVIVHGSAASPRPTRLSFSFPGKTILL